MNTVYIIHKAVFDYGNSKQLLDLEKEIYEGYDFEFLEVRSIQLYIEPTKTSTGSYIGLPTDLKNSKSIINIRKNNYNCLKLSITAWLHPARDHANREIIYVNNLN